MHIQLTDGSGVYFLIRFPYDRDGSRYGEPGMSTSYAIVSDSSKGA